MQLAFEINKTLLASSALFRKGSKNLNTTEWINLKNQLWEKYQEPYNFFLHKPDFRHIASQDDYPQNLQKIAKNTPKLLKKVIESPEFDDLLATTENYKAWLEKEWNQKKEKTLKEMEDILKIQLPNKTFKVFVIAPIIGGGSYLGNYKIFWGHEEDWPNYNIVYLMHEVLHAFIHKGKYAHEVIELATDNELRIRLNGKGEYFMEGNKKVGHPKQLKKEKELLPKWEEYLKDESTDVYSFIREISS